MDNVMVPSSGLYINSLAGINTEILQDAADSDGKTFDRMWADVQEIAGYRFFSDTNSKLAAKFKMPPNSKAFAVTGSVPTGILPVEQAKKGIILDFVATELSMQTIYISGVGFYSYGEGANTLVVQDEGGNILHSQAVNVVDGLNTWFIKKGFPLQTLFIGINFATLPTPDSLILGTASLVQALSGITNGATVSIAGAKFKDGSYDILPTAGNGFTSIIGTMTCRYSSLVCSRKDLLAPAFMYLLGNQIMLEIEGSNRINKTTTVNAEKYDQLKNFYQVEYESELKRVIEGITLSDYDGCVNCKKNPEKVVWLP